MQPLPTNPRSPHRASPLGLLLTACLLVGLLFWRLAVPNASPWLDILILSAAGVFLMWIRSRVRKPPGRWRR